MYELVIDYMNFQASVSVDETNNRVPLAPANEPSSPTLNVERAPPLCERRWRSFFNSDGRILNESCLRKAIFKGTLFVLSDSFHTKTKQIMFDSCVSMQYQPQRDIGLNNSLVDMDL
jgi:hypothetical protein